MYLHGVQQSLSQYPEKLLHQQQESELKSKLLLSQYMTCRSHIRSPKKAK
jgi:hypothetical protein